MVNITDDIWNTEPALRPEDEIALRKLHDMLQSTAEDLKALTGELSKYHEPGVQVKTLPTPLDDDFNEKVHIEEVVNAKFHGYKVVDRSKPAPDKTQSDAIRGLIKSMASDKPISKKINAGIQVNQAPILKKASNRHNLAVSRTKIIQINDNVDIASGGNTENSEQHKEKAIKPIVAYKEISFKYVEPNVKKTFSKPLQVQNMPRINIRSELTEQKVLQINIDPTDDNFEHVACKSNIAVISVQHEPVTVQKTVPNTKRDQLRYSTVPPSSSKKEPTRKFSKLSSCESSASSNNENHEVNAFRVTKPHKMTKTINRVPSKTLESDNTKNKKNGGGKKESTKRTNLDLWKKKLNSIYNYPSSLRQLKTGVSKNKVPKTGTVASLPSCSRPIKNTNTLNNTEYIPYSKLTLGGVKVSDIEKELSEVSNKNDITLGPILDKILSRENSFHNESPRHKHKESPKILSTSDENLLQEVLDIEQKVGKTMSENISEMNMPNKEDHSINVCDVCDQDSYIDDFEDEESECSALSKNTNPSDEAHSEQINSGKSIAVDNDKGSLKSFNKQENMQRRTKTQNLSFKNKVDIFEFVHSVDTQDTGTQSNGTNMISLKDTQTSPRNDSGNVQPIHNDLWSIDSKGEVQKLFQLEKDFIKKLIVEEYGDLLEKSVNKPSSSKDFQITEDINVVASQKNTQTSPAHVKSVMTSPTRTKTRTTSPFALSLTVDRQTSPVVVEELNVNIDDGDDLGISINLSSPRFSLRLPQNSREVMSTLESHTQSKHNHIQNARESRMTKKNAVSSSSSADGDYSSSDISSLGEVRFRLKKRFRKLQVPSISELSSSPSLSKCSSDISDAIIPLRSEGEVSFGQARRIPKKNNTSDGEISLGRLYE